MGNNIVSISIYTNSQRIKLTPDLDGRFLVPNPIASFAKPLIRMSAVELVNHSKLKHMDPVLTLDDGSKLRVFQGGDPTAILTIAISLLEKHDKKHEKPKRTIPVTSRKTKSTTTIIPPFNSTYVDSDISDYDYPWDDDSFYDDTD